MNSKRKELERARATNAHNKTNTTNRTPEDVIKSLWTLRDVDSTSLKKTYKEVRKGVL